MKHNNITYRNVPRETFTKVDHLIDKCKDELDNYFTQLMWWNERINLVSRNVPRETIWEHIRHSLLISPFKAFKSADSIVDAGTGGGLPGIPLAIAHPEKHFVLNDIVSKKCVVLKQISQKLKLENVTISDGPVEELDQKKPFLLTTKHAFKINELYAMTAHLPWQKMILYKGINFENELEKTNEDIRIDAWKLSKGAAFYNNKALIIISRKQGYLF